MFFNYYFLFVIQVIGVLMMILAIWMLADPTFLMSLSQEQNNYHYGIYILLAVGALLVVVSFFGCCGAFKESQCMLVSFFCCLLVVLTAEVAAGVWATYNSAKLETLARSTIKYTVSNEYGTIPSRTLAFDSFQKMVSLHTQLALFKFLFAYFIFSWNVAVLKVRTFLS
jgi:CD81 antigen